MPRKRVTAELYIYMNGIPVGVLTRKASGELLFNYQDTWLQHPERRPISLSLPLSDVTYQDERVQYFFENLLPDNELIRERIQRRFKASSKKSFDLLSHIGADCVGALQLMTQPLESSSRTIQAMPISDTEIAQLLKQYRVAPLGMNEDSDFRISIAGAQEKTALLRLNNQWHLPHGTTPTTHIIKLPIGRIEHVGMDLSDSVENEWLCLRILAAYGLPVSQASIVYFDDMKTLVVERFDRRWVDDGDWLLRLPQEDMCQVLSVAPSLKYEADSGPGIAAIMRVLGGANKPNIDRGNFMKTVFLFWVLGAIDGHAKNFSISIEAKARYHLTPLYDVMSAYPLAAKRQLEWRKLKMAMAVKGKNQHYRWHEIQPRHWLAMAKLCKFPEEDMQRIIDEVRDNMESVIDEVITELPQDFPPEMADAIFAGMRKVKKKL